MKVTDNAFNNLLIALKSSNSNSVLAILLPIVGRCNESEIINLLARLIAGNSRYSIKQLFEFAAIGADVYPKKTNEIFTAGLGISFDVHHRPEKCNFGLKILDFSIQFQKGHNSVNYEFETMKKVKMLGDWWESTGKAYISIVDKSDSMRKFALADNSDIEIYEMLLSSEHLKIAETFTKYFKSL